MLLCNANYVSLPSSVDLEFQVFSYNRRIEYNLTINQKKFKMF